MILLIFSVLMEVIGQISGQVRGLYAVQMFQDKISSEKLIRTVTTPGEFGCISYCIQDINCVSFFIKESTSECQLHNVTFVDSTSLLAASGWTYYKVYTDLCKPYIESDFDFVESRTYKFCYKIYIMPQVDLFTYKAICEGQGGELMRIESQEKQDYMASFLEHVNINFIYINANDTVTEGIWRYDDGTPLVYTNWNTGQPDGLVNEHYIMMRNNFNYKWHDAEAVYIIYSGAMLCQVY